MDLGRAGDQLVPAHHSFAEVDFVQPNVGLTDQGLLHKLATVGYQEQLRYKEKKQSEGFIFKNYKGLMELSGH